jgi:predicted nucleic acid-binding protein
MANAVLVDSSFYIGRQRSGRDPFDELAAAGAAWDVTTCGMVMLEVLRGARVPRLSEHYRAAFATMVCVPTTHSTWMRAMDLLVALDARGQPIPPQDAIIAACAFSIQAPVLSFDGHLASIPDLVVLDSLP